MGVLNIEHLSFIHQLLVDAGIPIDGVAEDGRLDFKPEATAQQIEQANTIRDGFDPAEAEARQEELKQAPLTAIEYFKAHPAAIDFIRLTPEAQETAIDAMTLAQIKTVVKYMAVAVSAVIKREYL